MTDFKKSVFIFRRDLRIEDNSGLINALELSECVYCIYILDKGLLSPAYGYSSFQLPIQMKYLYQKQQIRYNLIRFLKDSLMDLQNQFEELEEPLHGSLHKKNKLEKRKSTSKIQFLHGSPSKIINKLLKLDKEIEAVFVNKDYTPYSKRRDDKIKEACHNNGRKMFLCPDILLNEPEEIMNSNNQPYKVFFHYYNRARQMPDKEKSTYNQNMFKNKLCSPSDKLLDKFNIDEKINDLNTFFSFIKNMFPNDKNDNDDDTQFIVGRRKYFDIISEFTGMLEHAEKDKDKKQQLQNSKLSPYIKFGVCSIREVFSIFQEKFGRDHPFLRQLYWRDFFTYVGFHYPRVFSEPFQQKYIDINGESKIKWKNDPKHFKLWCNGKTGFPIVDAGMRELNNTGYLSNRHRLITASFLIKDLHIDWRYGERYFALKLVDYDPCVNNGNWQWVASTGCDALPYFRIFNPWLQQKKFDPDCVHIKKWLPELRGVANKSIHEWYKNMDKRKNIYNKYDSKEVIEFDYPNPIVDHAFESALAKELYNISK